MLQRKASKKLSETPASRSSPIGRSRRLSAAGLGLKRKKDARGSSIDSDGPASDPDSAETPAASAVPVPKVVLRRSSRKKAKPSPAPLVPEAPLPAVKAKPNRRRRVQKAKKAQDAESKTGAAAATSAATSPITEPLGDVDPRSAPVPLPSKGPVPEGGGRKCRSEPARERYARRASYTNAQRWKKTVPTYRVDVSLEQLAKRTKNTLKDKAKAEAKIAQMRSASADAGSMLLLDRHGKPMVGVFSHAMRGPTKKSGGKYPVYPGPEGRTLDDITEDMKFDGLGEDTLSNYHWYMQVLASFFHPVANKRDVRHNEPPVMAYPPPPKDGSCDCAATSGGAQFEAGCNGEKGSSDEGCESGEDGKDEGWEGEDEDEGNDGSDEGCESGEEGKDEGWEGEDEDEGNDGSDEGCESGEEGKDEGWEGEDEDEGNDRSDDAAGAPDDEWGEDSEDDGEGYQSNEEGELEDENFGSEVESEDGSAGDKSLGSEAEGEGDEGTAEDVPRSDFESEEDNSPEGEVEAGDDGAEDGESQSNGENEPCGVSSAKGLSKLEGVGPTPCCQIHSRIPSDPVGAKEPLEDEPSEYDRAGLEEESDTEGSPYQNCERKGVMHLVHCWCGQGQSKGPMTPSRNMCGKSCTSAQSVRTYFQGTTGTAWEINHRFQVSFPDEFELYSQAFAAGQWEPADPGPFLGRALVWKLQVRVHRDGLDKGPAAIFPCGFFTGGELYLPDLGVKLAYRPGDLVILYAGALYHAVEQWKPLHAPANKGVSPGRASSVFFFPRHSFKQLQGKQPKWLVRTMSGRLHGKHL